MARKSDATPMPLPKAIRVESSAPRKVLWEKLSDKEKRIASHLFKAGDLGRTLLFYQSHRHSLTIRMLIETALSKVNLEDTKTLLGEAAFNEFLLYSAKFLDGQGPYASSNRKYILEKVTAKQVDQLFGLYLPEFSPQGRAEIVKLLTDPTYEVMQYPENPDGEGLEFTGGNLYEKSITGKEVKDAIASGILKTNLNCRVVRASQGLACELQSVNTKGPVGKTLKAIVQELRKAEIYALTDLQKKQIQAMVAFFEGGDIEQFRQANIAWVKDRSNSVVDFMIGYVEVYEDWLARIGSWESYVQVVDPEVSKSAQQLAKHAQYFENGMPFGKFKKTFPEDYSPPAIMVYYFQELASYRSGGYNLPNFDDIRRDVGAKNVIRLPLPGEDQDPMFNEIVREFLNEFSAKGKAEPIVNHWQKIRRAIVLMHEIIGHGSGTFDEAKYTTAEGKLEDPIAGLGSLGSALEEQRADLAALVYLGDQKLVEMGFYKDAADALNHRNLGYDYYLADFLRRTAGQHTFAEAHQRGHLLFINQLFHAGAIAWESKDGSTLTDENAVLVVKDYDLYHKVATDSLAQLQDIKANRKTDELKTLFATQANLDDIKKNVYQAIIARGKDLKINAGYVEQPWRITDDYKIELFGDLTLSGIAPHWEALSKGEKPSAPRRVRGN